MNPLRPPLNAVPLASVFPIRSGLAYCTMSTGQRWDGLLQAAYACGYVLLELDDDERPVAAYRTAEASA